MSIGPRGVSVGGTQEAGKASIRDCRSPEGSCRDVPGRRGPLGLLQALYRYRAGWLRGRRPEANFADWPVPGHRESEASHQDIQQRWEKKREEKTKRNRRSSSEERDKTIRAGPDRLQEKKFTRKKFKSTSEIVGRKSFRDPETSQASGTQGHCTWVIGHTGTDITPNPAVPQLTPPVTVCLPRPSPTALHSVRPGKLRHGLEDASRQSARHHAGPGAMAMLAQCLVHVSPHTAPLKWTQLIRRHSEHLQEQRWQL